MTRILLGMSLLIAATAAQAQDMQPPQTGATSSPLKQLREQCRADAMSQGLKGPARTDAINACVIKARPDQAKVIQCRTEGKAKGLAKDELRAYVKSCKKAG